MLFYSWLLFLMIEFIFGDCHDHFKIVKKQCFNSSKFLEWIQVLEKAYSIEIVKEKRN